MDFYSIDELQKALQDKLYMADRGLVTALFLALKLKRPLFLEGEPGVGKTEIAKVLAGVLDTTLIRLQCYEGLDLNQAVYEWNYTRQMLHIRLLEARGEHARDTPSSLAASFCCNGRCYRPLRKRGEARPSCSSTKSTAVMRNLKPSCWRSSPTSRSPSLKSAQSRPRE